MQGILIPIVSSENFSRPLDNLAFNPRQMLPGEKPRQRFFKVTEVSG